MAYKQGGYPGTIGVIHALEYKYPYDPACPGDIQAAKNDDVLQNRLLLDATFRGDYAPDTLQIIEHLCQASNGSVEFLDDDLSIMRRAAQLNDCLGINYYQSRFLKAFDGETDLHHNGTGDKGTGRWRVAGVGERAVRPGVPTTDWDWIIYPKGLFDLMMDISLRYPNYKQLFITENGMGRKDQLVDGTVDDSERIAYVEDHLRWILKAIECGVDVGGYFMWSLQDQFSWTNGYNKRYGFFYVDFETQQRTPKASASVSLKQASLNARAPCQHRCRRGRIGFYRYPPAQALVLHINYLIVSGVRDQPQYRTTLKPLIKMMATMRPQNNLSTAASSMCLFTARPAMPPRIPQTAMPASSATSRLDTPPATAAIVLAACENKMMYSELWAARLVLMVKK